jgi:hypothetical protein
VLRIYREVFGVSGGIDATRALADQSIDPVAERLYAMLDARVAPLLSDRGERAFLQAITSYHLLGEGVIARTAQNLAVGQYERFGDFPGFLAGQRLVAAMKRATSASASPTRGVLSPAIAKACV